MKSLIKSTALVFLSGLLVAFIFRILFFIFLRSPEVETSFQSTSFALVHGVRFDLSALCALNLIFVLLIYFKKVRQNSMFLNVWAILNTTFIFLLVADFFYYSVYSSRLSWDFLAVFNGLQAHILFSMMSQFLIAIPVLIISFLAFRYLLRKVFLNLESNLKVAWYPLYFVLVGLVFVTVYRGGLQKRVLSPQHTWLFADGSSFYAAMTSNTLHNLLRQGDSLKLPQSFKNLKQSYLPTWDKNNQSHLPLLSKKPKNVLFIFIESLSSYSYENQKLPRLKEWADKNENDLYVNTHFYANGNLSKDALLSVFFGIPSYFDIHLFESKYAKNTIAGIGQIAKQTDKETFFLHAAPAGTQFFDVISKAAGFESYVSLYDEYEDDKSKVSSWGVHDEVLYDGAIKYIKKLNAPFIGTLFTTSTHTPFFGTPNNPDDKEDEVDYFLAVNYADQALVSFFDQASKQPWFKDTLFVITGDHSPPLSSAWNRTQSEMSRIPLMMYWSESGLGNVNFKTIGRHVDIPKTVFHILGDYPEMWTAYGQSLVQQNPEDLDSKVFYTSSGTVNLVTAPKTIVTQSIYESENAQPQFERAQLELKDYIYRLEKNSIYD